MYWNINTYGAIDVNPTSPSTPQPRVSSLQNSNRNNPGNRNRRNSPDINNLIFFNRYKIGGYETHGQPHFHESPVTDHESQGTGPSDDATSIVTLSDQRESKGPFHDPTRTCGERSRTIVTLPALTQEGREQRDERVRHSFPRISTRNTSASRNHHNPLAFNHLTFSTRNKTEGVRQPMITPNDRR